MICIKIFAFVTPGDRHIRRPAPQRGYRPPCLPPHPHRPLQVQARLRYHCLTNRQYCTLELDRISGPFQYPIGCQIQYLADPNIRIDEKSRPTPWLANVTNIINAPIQGLRSIRSARAWS